MVGGPLISNLLLNQQSVFDADAFTENAIPSYPAVDQSSIVSNLISVSADGLYDVQVIVAADPADDVANLERSRIDRDNGAKLAGLDPPFIEFPRGRNDTVVPPRSFSM
jgi:hypothetical protein